MGPAGAESLLKYVKFDIIESILSFSSFLAPAGGNWHYINNHNLDNNNNKTI